MKNFIMPGVTTALVTPFRRDGTVNLPVWDALLDRQLEAGIRSIVVCGTTGEAPTLSFEEKRTLFTAAKKRVGTRARIIAGTGSNSTAQAIRLSKMAMDTGADGLLVVTPYYNKASAKGLMAHYEAVAEAAALPVILYNVPSRTGVDLPVDICRRLAEVPNIAGIKEANPDLRKAQALISACPKGFSLWSGNDDLLLPMLSLGAQGVISVCSNVLPEAMKRITDCALEEHYSLARTQFAEILPLIKALFSEVNPIPVKAAMAILGYDCGECRLPLTALGGEACAELEAILSAAGKNHML